MSDATCQLYLITPQRLDPKAFRAPLAAALDAGDIACLQLRLKDATEDEVARAVEILMPIAAARDVAFLLNDNAALADKLGCDGAHLGQGDGDHTAARRVLDGRILGITCHASRHLAMEAGESGADYVAFGAFFPTESKETIHRATPEILTWWREMFEIPSVAIGGITAENCAPLVQAGADFLAVIGAVWNHPAGPAEGIRTMSAAIEAAIVER
jgi:thiamine-phosphate pyrophosphorylase